MKVLSSVWGQGCNNFSWKTQTHQQEKSHYWQGWPFNTFITRKTIEKEDNDIQDYDHKNDGKNENYYKENYNYYGKNDDNVSKVLGVPEALLLIAPACYYSQTQLLTPTKHKSLNYKSMQENTSRTEHEPLIIKPADLEYAQYKGLLKFYLVTARCSLLRAGSWCEQCFHVLLSTRSCNTSA